MRVPGLAHGCPLLPEEGQANLPSLQLACSLRLQLAACHQSDPIGLVRVKGLAPAHAALNGGISNLAQKLAAKSRPNNVFLSRGDCYHSDEGLLPQLVDPNERVNVSP